MNENDIQAQPYSVRLPASMRRQLDEHAKQHERSLHAEILLRPSASLGKSKLSASYKINNLSGKTEYVTREEVERMIREALGRHD